MLTFEGSKIRETIIEYIPSDTFIADIKVINSGNFKLKQFDGVITFKNIKEDSKIVWYLSKGKIVKKGKRVPYKKKTQQQIDMYGIMVVTVILFVLVMARRNIVKTEQSVNGKVYGRMTQKNRQ